MLASDHPPDNIGGQMLQSTTATSNVPEFLLDLRSRGWAILRQVADDEAGVVASLKTMGSTLGPFSQGRSKSVQEVLRPQAQQEAHPRSLSAIFGTDQLPFHCELSHRTTPCRFLLLGCIDPGAPASATLLVDWTRIELTDDEIALLESAPVLVRTGRRSFYSTVLPKHRRYLRYDPGCIEAVDKRGTEALRVARDRLRTAEVQRHEWMAGDILVVDNWRVLHGREASQAGNERRLARVLIDG